MLNKRLALVEIVCIVAHRPVIVGRDYCYSTEATGVVSKVWAGDLFQFRMQEVAIMLMGDRFWEEPVPVEIVGGIVEAACASSHAVISATSTGNKSVVKRRRVFTMSSPSVSHLSGCTQCAKRRVCSRIR